jgi:hypothetical protein
VKAARVEEGALSRFDAKIGRRYGADSHVAFIESFQIAGIRPVVTESKLRERSLSRIRIVVRRGW